MNISPRVQGCALAFVQGYIAAAGPAIGALYVTDHLTADVIRILAFVATAGGCSGIVNYLRVPKP